MNITGNLKIYGEVVWGSEHLSKAIPDLEVSRPIKIGNDGNDVLILSGVNYRK